MALPPVAKDSAKFAALVAELRDDPEGIGYPLDDPEACYRLLACPDRPAPATTVKRSVSRDEALKAVPSLVDAEIALRDAAAGGDNAATVVLDAWSRLAIDWTSDLGTALLARWTGLAKGAGDALKALCVVAGPRQYLPSRRAVVLGKVGTRECVKAATAAARA